MGLLASLLKNDAPIYRIPLGTEGTQERFHIRINRRPDAIFEGKFVSSRVMVSGKLAAGKLCVNVRTVLIMVSSVVVFCLEGMG